MRNPTGAWVLAGSVLLGIFLSLRASTPVAAQTVAESCTSEARVSWDIDAHYQIVKGADVALPGCPNGVRVTLEILTAEGAPTEPTVGSVRDERAYMDLTRFDLHIRPVVGVRVSLYGDTLVLADTEVRGRTEETRASPKGSEKGGLLPRTGADISLSLVLSAIVAIVLGAGYLRVSRWLQRTWAGRGSS